MKYIIVAILLLLQTGCSISGAKKGIDNVPTDTLIGINILKGDTSDPNYCTHNLTVSNFRIDSEGNIWIADWGGRRLLKYNPEGEYQYQIVFDPDTTIISGKSPKYDFKEHQCLDFYPNLRIEHFWFDRNGTLFAFAARLDSSLEQGEWRRKYLPETRVLRKNGTHQIIKQDSSRYCISEYAAVDSQNRLYLALHSVMWRGKKDQDKSLVAVSDSTFLVISEISCPPVFERNWNLLEKNKWNSVVMTTDEKDNLWVAFLYQPLVRKYDSKHILIFERKYLTSDLREMFAKRDSMRMDMAKKNSDNQLISASNFPFFRSITSSRQGGVLLFTSSGITYELDQKGNILRKVVLIPNDATKGKKALSYAADRWGNIYGLIEKWNSSVIHHLQIYKFSEQRKDVKVKKRLNKFK